MARNTAPTPRDPLSQFATDFIGTDRVDPVHCLGGGMATRRRVYLDSTATALMPRAVWNGMYQYLESASANSHTDAHRAGRDTTQAIEDSRAAIGRLCGYDPCGDVVLFTSNGATGAINFLARALFPPELRSSVKRFDGSPPDDWLAVWSSALGENGARTIEVMRRRPLVVVTAMEHHSNLLPWMEAVGMHHIRVVNCRLDGTLDLDHLDRILEREGERIRLVAVTGVSNVTGIVNPVHDIAARVHRVGAEILVDGAQWVPHGTVQMHTGIAEQDIDYLVLSGHKVYAPGSRGALVGKLAALEECRCVTDVGGGMVEYVSIDDFILKDQVTAREEPGTPNIPGSIAMGLVAELLLAIGMDRVEAAEHELTGVLLDRLRDVPTLRIMGSDRRDEVPRAGVVSFDIPGLPHGLVAAYLNDFHNIAVRNGCFCAQPYVKALLALDCDIEEQYQRDVMSGDRSNVPGLVRASLGIHSTSEDVAALGEALDELLANRDAIVALYHCDKSGDYRLVDTEPLPQTFSVRDSVSAWLEGEGTSSSSGR